eukprot:GHVU01180634.1.p1 GENE.GHVU01180634.1~~GHVU01180634.1.p1  ORF type:complete len:240 (+),score=4.36 GHVU01180634.1:139-858(+)
MSKNAGLTHSIWALVPAAGIGKRMQSDIPKQYLSLNGRPVIEHTINALLDNEHISGLVIALNANDEYWQTIKINANKPVLTAVGGEERADSVLSGLNCLAQHETFNADTDWVMVHDAVRPCLRQEDIDKLVDEVKSEAGGLLALPVRDTMKRQKEGEATVASTVNRENLWHALTPQYFPAKALQAALQEALNKGLAVTDESSALEMAGYAPTLVHGNEENIKITRPDDLRLASLYLQSR